VLTLQALASKIYSLQPGFNNGIYRYNPVDDSLDYITFPLYPDPTEKKKKSRNKSLLKEQEMSK